MANPTVSVIMANYNAVDHLPVAVQSVLAQSLSDIEILLSDDASTDASVTVAQEIATRDPRLKIITAPHNAGPAAARNRALTRAKGEWIAIVDSDDIIHPQRLARLVAAAEQLDTDAIADDLTYLIDNQVQNGATLLGAARQSGPRELTARTFIAPSADAPKLGYLKAMIRRSALRGLTYREDIRIGEDHDFYVRFLLNGGKMHLLPQSYYLYRRHTLSLSHRLHPDDIMAMIRVQDDLLTSYPDLPHDLRADLAARRAALQEPLAFETLADNLRQKRIGPALTNILRQPALISRLGGVIGARILRQFRPSPRRQTTTDPSEWTLQDWAQVSASGIPS